MYLMIGKHGMEFCFVILLFYLYFFFFCEAGGQVLV